MGTKFKNLSNDYVEEASSLAWLWALLFGPLYFGIKGVWPHALGSLILALVTFGISHFVYCFFANSIIRKSYLKKGWVEITDDTNNIFSEINIQHREDTSSDPVDKKQILLIIVFAIIAVFVVSYYFDTTDKVVKEPSSTYNSSSSSSSNSSSSSSKEPKVNKDWNDYTKYSTCYGQMTKAHKARGFHDRNRVASIDVKETVCSAYSRGEISSYEGKQ